MRGSACEIYEQSLMANNPNPFYNISESAGAVRYGAAEGSMRDIPQRFLLLPPFLLSPPPAITLPVVRDGLINSDYGSCCCKVGLGNTCVHTSAIQFVSPFSRYVRLHDLPPVPH